MQLRKSAVILHIELPKSRSRRSSSAWGNEFVSNIVAKPRSSNLSIASDPSWARTHNKQRTAKKRACFGDCCVCLACKPGPSNQSIPLRPPAASHPSPPPPPATHCIPPSSSSSSTACPVACSDTLPPGPSLSCLQPTRELLFFHNLLFRDPGCVDSFDIIS